MPEGVEYLASWVTEDLRRCYQIVECADRGLLDQWMAHWQDVTSFQVVPVLKSADAAAAVSPRL